MPRAKSNPRKKDKDRRREINGKVEDPAILRWDALFRIRKIPEGVGEIPLSRRPVYSLQVDNFLIFPKDPATGESLKDKEGKRLMFRVRRLYLTCQQSNRAFRAGYRFSVSRRGGKDTISRKEARQVPEGDLEGAWWEPAGKVSVEELLHVLKACRIENPERVLDELMASGKKKGGR